jgi:hypothetical protein
VKARFGALLIVTGAYLVTVLVIWLLSLIGPIDSAFVDGRLTGNHLEVWFVTAGVMGSFLIIAGVALAFILRAGK